MTERVITVSSDDSISHASRLMNAHGLRRLPVVDGRELVGIIGERMIAALLPSAATGLSAPEMANTLSRLNVGNYMKKTLTTVTPGTTAETALFIAQKAQVGSLLVVDDDGRLVGIVTTNDFFYRLVNPLLGIGQPGSRIHIYDCDSTDRIAQVVALIARHHLEIVIIHSECPAEPGPGNLIVQVNTADPDDLVRDLIDCGFRAAVRERKFWLVAPQTA